VGGVLMHNDMVITYKSYKLKENEQKYYAYDLALTAVVYALKLWRHYLLGKRFLLKIDHNRLTSFFNQRTLNAHQARWTAFLSE